MKTLIAFATRYGSTARTAELLAEVIGKPGVNDVTVLDARKAGRAKVGDFDAFIVGSSIAMGRWKGSAKRLLPRLAATGRPVAVFVTAGGVLSGREPGSDPAAPVTRSLEQRENEAIERYLRPAVEAAGLKPAAEAAFGGRMAMFGKEQFDNWDGERIKAWGSTLATKLR
jgi:menaquinone-dependent protoporphyrinogen IX oxidase